MRIAISGSSGLIGASVALHLEARGHEVLRLVRGQAQGPDEIAYDIAGGLIDVEALGRADAVIHLAGESVGDGRWSATKKERILSSRVQGTRLIASALASMKPEERPHTLICASAIGIYGPRGGELLDERSDHGTDFLANVCERWEQAGDAARAAGVRTVHARMGVVLAQNGGALSKMLTPFRLGLGGVLGSGEQWMSWISLADAVGALVHLVEHRSLSGPVNVCGPKPVSNREFTKSLGKHLHRPAVLPMPAFAARLAFGERADALLLSSARVSSLKLERSGYRFHHRDVDHALADVLDVTHRDVNHGAAA